MVIYQFTFGEGKGKRRGRRGGREGGEMPARMSCHKEGEGGGVMFVTCPCSQSEAGQGRAGQDEAKALQGPRKGNMKVWLGNEYMLTCVYRVWSNPHVCYKCILIRTLFLGFIST